MLYLTSLYEPAAIIATHPSLLASDRQHAAQLAPRSTCSDAAALRSVQTQAGSGAAADLGLVAADAQHVAEKLEGLSRLQVADAAAQPQDAQHLLRVPAQYTSSGRAW